MRKAITISTALTTWPYSNHDRMGRPRSATSSRRKSPTHAMLRPGITAGALSFHQGWSGQRYSPASPVSAMMLTATMTTCTA